MGFFNVAGKGPRFMIPYMYTGVSWPVNNLNMTAGIVFMLICWGKGKTPHFNSIHVINKLRNKNNWMQKCEKGWWLKIKVNLFWLTAKSKGCKALIILHNCTVLAYCFEEFVLYLSSVETENWLNYTVITKSTYIHFLLSVFNSF